jgi:hypothetical protein
MRIWDIVLDGVDFKVQFTFTSIFSKKRKEYIVVEEANLEMGATNQDLHSLVECRRGI